MSQLDLIALQTPVFIGAQFEITGTLTAITLRPARAGLRVQYEVTWWDNEKRCSDWFDESEVKTQDKLKPIKLGFI